MSDAVNSARRVARRDFLKTAAFGVGAAGAAGLARPATAAERRKPNIIFFLVDDYDKPETSVYGGKVLTPNLDRLAKGGMTFHNAHMTSTVCTPSRYTCLTGRYAGSSHFPDYLEECPAGSQGLPAFNVGLEDDNMNVGGVLARHGYATGYVGKFHVGTHLDEEDCRAHGLHYIRKDATFTPEVNRRVYENEKVYRRLVMKRGFTWAKNIYWGNMLRQVRGHNPEWTVTAALEFIEANRDRPFYLHYCTTLLHGPNMEWHRSLGKPLITGEGLIEKPLGVMPPRETVMRRIRETGLTEQEAGYLWMDDSLGVLLDKLDELGIAEDTLVLFIADHGSEMKGSLYKQRGTEVPCIMRWPAGMKRNVRCRELVQNTDFVPTWFDMAGVRAPAGYKIDGVSLVPLFSRPDEPVRDHVYGEIGPARTVRTKDWSYMALRYTKDQIAQARAGTRAGTKRLLGLSGGVSRGSRKANSFKCDQLYHLSVDPGETADLSGKAEHGGRLRAMKETLAAELRRFPERPYGEFVPGGNAAPAGSFDDVLAGLAALSRAGDSKKKRKKKAGRK
jgi:arylsulfatase A-like enzyme